MAPCVARLSAIWLAQKAVDNGWAGIIVYGCIRDSDALANMPIGVKALGTHPMNTDNRGEGQRDIVRSLRRRRPRRSRRLGLRRRSRRHRRSPARSADVSGKERPRRAHARPFRPGESFHLLSVESGSGRAKHSSVPARSCRVAALLLGAGDHPPARSIVSLVTALGGDEALARALSADGEWLAIRFRRRHQYWRSRRCNGDQQSRRESATAVRGAFLLDGRHWGISDVRECGILCERRLAGKGQLTPRSRSLRLRPGGDELPRYRLARRNVGAKRGR